MILDIIRNYKNTGVITLRKSYSGGYDVRLMRTHDHMDIILCYPNDSIKFLVSIWDDGDIALWHWSIGGTLIGLRRYYNRERQLYDIDGKYIKDIET